MDTLVRKEVLDAKRGDWLGTIRLTTPVSHRLLILSTIAVGVALAAFLWFGEYTRREPASGVLVPSAGLIDVTATSSAVVTAVKATEGDSVSIGDPLVALTSQRASASSGNTNLFLADQFRSQRMHLDADMAEQKQMERQKSDELARRIDMLRSQLILLDQQLSIQKQQTASSIALLNKIQPLQSKGYISIMQVQQQEMAILQAQSSEKLISRQRLDVQQQLVAAQGQFDQLPLTTEAENHELAVRRADVERTLAENDVELASILHAPKSGVVSSVLVKPGQSVVAGQPLLAIVPEGSTLVAQIFVSNRTIGLISRGDIVVMHYQAFPFQHFGLHHGKINAISQSAITPAQMASMTGMQTKESLYRVDVALDAQSVESDGSPRPLRPGMVVDAQILLDRHRLIDWIFEPFYGSGRGS